MPSRWYDAGGHRANFSELQDRIAELEDIVTRMDSVESRVSASEQAAAQNTAAVEVRLNSLASSVSQLDDFTL